MSGPRCTTRSEGPWPAPARAWPPRHPNCPQAGRARGPRRRRPAPKSGSPSTAPRCSPIGLCLSHVTCPKPHASPWGASAGAGPRDARYEPSWHRGRRYASGAVGPRPRWPNWPNCGVGSSGSDRWVRHASNSFPPRWQRPSRFLTTRCGPPPRRRWSGATGVLARCQRVSTRGGRTSRSVRVLRWICGVKPEPQAGNKPWHHFILHGLDKPGSSATVSNKATFHASPPAGVSSHLACVPPGSAPQPHPPASGGRAR
jgi:hypothetical protein